jgi:hypothetical protein
MITTLPQKLIQAIESGRALLFTGAGFSSKCKNFKDKTPPRSKSLAEGIGNLGDFDSEKDLKFATEYYLSQGKSKTDLVNFLKETYTLKETKEEHKKIARLPWMRCYTTNYDNSLELAGSFVGKRYTTVDVSDSPQDHPRNNLVVHINGAVTNLTSEKLETSFKLSQSSYLTDEGFKKSAWFRNFKQDLDRCSAIVFIGYSLYDFEIEKLLSEQDALCAYFITKEKIKVSDKFNYEKYGDTIQCETCGFADLISGIEVEAPQGRLESLGLIPYELKTDKEPTDLDVERLFIYGTISQELVASSIIGQFQNQYVIQRKLESLLTSLDKNNFIITGELGTGKTIFLRQLGLSLSKKGFRVYQQIDLHADIYKDLEYLATQPGLSVLLLDDYTNNPDVLYYIGNNYPQDKFAVIATSRPSSHMRLQARLNEEKFGYSSYSIDSLDSTEVSNLVEVTNTLGGWDDLAAVSSRQKQDYILRKTPTFATFLLKLFNSKTIRDRINSDLVVLLSNPKIKETIFGICVLVLANLRATYELISEVAQTDLIRSSDLKQKTVFNDFFKTINYAEINISSIFAQHFLQNQFSAGEVQDRFLSIAERFDKVRGISPDSNILFKHVLKFSSLERSLSEENKKQTFNTYYDLLKRRVGWLRTDPHFWLQYGMAKIALRDFDKAQSHLDNAYKFADQKNFSYDKSKIDTQQARLWLLQFFYCEDAEVNEKFELFKNANKKLKSLEDDKYKYRQLSLYPKIIRAKVLGLSEQNKEYLRRACLYISKRDQFLASTIREEGQMESIRKGINDVLDEI